MTSKNVERNARDFTFCRAACRAIAGAKFFFEHKKTPAVRPGFECRELDPRGGFSYLLATDWVSAFPVVSEGLCLARRVGSFRWKDYITIPSEYYLLRPTTGLPADGWHNGGAISTRRMSGARLKKAIDLTQEVDDPCPVSMWSYCRKGEGTEYPVVPQGERGEIWSGENYGNM